MHRRCQPVFAARSTLLTNRSQPSPYFRATKAIIVAPLVFNKSQYLGSRRDAGRQPRRASSPWPMRRALGGSTTASPARSKRAPSI